MAIGANTVRGRISCSVVGSSAVGSASTRSAFILDIVAPESLGFAGEEVAFLLTATGRATLLLEVVHAHGWESGGGMMMRFVVVDLVDWDCVVDDMWLDSLCVMLANLIQEMSVRLACACGRSAESSHGHDDAHARPGQWEPRSDSSRRLRAA